VAILCRGVRSQISRRSALLLDDIFFVDCKPCRQLTRLRCFLQRARCVLPQNSVAAVKCDKWSRFRYNLRRLRSLQLELHRITDICFVFVRCRIVSWNRIRMVQSCSSHRQGPFDIVTANPISSSYTSSNGVHSINLQFPDTTRCQILNSKDN